MLAVGYITRFNFFPAPVSLVVVDNNEFSVLFPSGRRDRIEPQPSQAFLDGSAWFRKLVRAMPVPTGCVGFALRQDEVIIGTPTDLTALLKAQLQNSGISLKDKATLIEFLENTEG